MRSIAVGALVSSLWLGGCLRATVNRCDNGAICKADQACTENPVIAAPAMQPPLCGEPALVDACHGSNKQQFDACTYSATANGTCHDGICSMCDPALAGCDATWDVMPSNTNDNLVGVWVRSTNDAFAIGAAGAVLRYDGFGWTHDAQSEAGIASLLGTTGKLVGMIGFDNPLELFVISDSDQVLRYSNGAWSDTAVPSQRSPKAIWGSSRTNIVTVGPFGEIWRFDGAAWTVMAPYDAASRVTYAGVGGSGPSDIYAVGENGSSLGSPTRADGMVHHFDGTSWSQVRQLTDQELLAVWASGPDHVFTAGPPATQSPLSQYTGGMWVDYPLAGNGAAIWGSGPSDVYVAGTTITGTAIYHFDGSAWMQVSSVAANAIAGSSATNVFAVGAAGKIWRYARNAAN